MVSKNLSKQNQCHGNFARIHYYSKKKKIEPEIIRHLSKHYPSMRLHIVKSINWEIHHQERFFKGKIHH